MFTHMPGRISIRRVSLVWKIVAVHVGLTWRVILGFSHDGSLAVLAARRIGVTAGWIGATATQMCAVRGFQYCVIPEAAVSFPGWWQARKFDFVKQVSLQCRLAAVSSEWER